MDQVPSVEFGSMSEVLHNLYAVTGDPQHRDLAHAFDRAAFRGPLARVHDNLTRIHANPHLPAGRCRELDRAHPAREGYDVGAVGRQVVAPRDERWMVEMGHEGATGGPDDRRPHLLGR
jgi:hypothetical protein